MGYIPGYSPLLSEAYHVNNVMSLDQLRASKNNRGIINTFNLVVIK